MQPRRHGGFLSVAQPRQVQIMSIVGRTGGKTGRNEDAAAFSEGFAWANFDTNSFFKSNSDDAGKARVCPLPLSAN